MWELFKMTCTEKHHCGSGRKRIGGEGGGTGNRKDGKTEASDFIVGETEKRVVLEVSVWWASWSSSLPSDLEFCQPFF